MLRPLALLKGYILLVVREETFCVRRTKNFTQNETTRSISRKRWRIEGSSVGQRQKSSGVAAGTVERHREAAAITMEHAGVHRGHTCPLCALLGGFSGEGKATRGVGLEAPQS